MQMQETRIPIHPGKAVLLLLGALAFVACGIAFVLYPERFDGFRVPPPAFVRIVGIISIVFFGTCLVHIFKKLLQASDGLRIDDKGITDNSTASAVGFIPWDDIEKIEPIVFNRQKFILIFVKHPDRYVQRQRSAILRKGMQVQNRQFGTPIVLATNILRIRHADLCALLEEAFEEYKRRK